MTKSVKAIIEPFKDRAFASDDSGNTITYGEAITLGNQICAKMTEDRALVFLLCDNSNATLSAYLHLLMSDHVFLLLDITIEDSLLSHLTQIYKPDYILRPDHDTNPVEALNQPDRTALHDDLSILLSTSGSTGSPKLARFTQDNILANAYSIAEYLDINQDDRPFCHLPMHYSFGFSIINSHLIKGAHIQLTKHSIMQRDFWDHFRTSQATSFSGVPFHLEMLKKLRFEQQDLPTLRYLSQAGGKLSPDLVAEFADLGEKNGYQFFVMYGQTEAGPRISYLPAKFAKTYPASIGKAIPGITLSLLTDDGTVIEAEDEVGELVCDSPAIMMGYALSFEDLSLGDQHEGRLITGDLAKRNRDGLYEITGRKNRFLKLQGNRVNLDEVESFVKKQPGISAACVGVDNMLYVVVESGHDLDDIRTRIIHALKFPPRCLTMKAIKALPRSDAGKIKYAALLQIITEETPS